MPSRRRLGQPADKLGAPAIERGPQRLDDRPARRLAAACVQFCDLISQRTPVDDRALAGDAAGRGHFWLTR